MFLLRFFSKENGSSVELPRNYCVLVSVLVCLAFSVLKTIC